MSLADGPHYELPSTELAAWIEQQGEDWWWFVDGDYLINGVVPMPCLGEDLAAELRRRNRPLLVRAPENDTTACGQQINRTGLDALVVRQGDGIATLEPRPLWVDNRELSLSWKGSVAEWILYEDRETTEAERTAPLLQQE